MRVLVRMDDEERALTLADALYAQGIAAHADAGRDGGMDVWVHDERQMEEARELAERFEQAPDDPFFAQAREEAAARRKRERREAEKNRHKTVDVRTRWRSQSGWGQVTIGLIVVSVAVTFLSGFGDNAEVTGELYFSRTRIVENLELWRIITPMFLHLGLIHLLFNMWWLKDFGSIIENRHSSAVFVAMVLVVGVLSNAAQALLVGEHFGGMSGVVYGLFGYLWVRGRLDPTWGIVLQQSTVYILVGWLLLGFIGLFQMANMCHLGGLLAGAAWGATAAWHARRR